MGARKHGDFGGDWTEEKLDRLAKYLPAYANIFKDRTYRYVIHRCVRGSWASRAPTQAGGTDSGPMGR